MAHKWRHIWKHLVNQEYIPDVPFRDVKFVIVAEGLEVLKTVGKLTSRNEKLLMKAMSDELLYSNGVKLRSKGNLREWSRRGVLLLDPLVMPSKSLTEILSRLAHHSFEPLTFVLVGGSANVYAPLIRNAEKDHVLHVLNHPGHGDSFWKSGVFVNTIDWNN